MERVANPTAAQRRILAPMICTPRASLAMACSVRSRQRLGFVGSTGGVVTMGPGRAPAAGLLVTIAYPAQEQHEPDREREADDEQRQPLPDHDVQVHRPPPCESLYAALREYTTPRIGTVQSRS